jgi:hypothetical protein
VELVGAYSNPSRASAGLAELRRQVEGSRVRRDARRIRRQKTPRGLSDTEVSQLAPGYPWGLTVHELAAQFGIRRETVSGLPEGEGVPRRRRPPSPSPIETSSVLHESRWSLARVSAELGCDPSTASRAGEVRQRAGGTSELGVGWPDSSIPSSQLLTARNTSGAGRLLHVRTERIIKRVQSRIRGRGRGAQFWRRSIAPERSCPTTSAAEWDSVIPPTP